MNSIEQTSNIMHEESFFPVNVKSVGVNGRPALHLMQQACSSIVECKSMKPLAALPSDPDNGYGCLHLLMAMSQVITLLNSAELFSMTTLNPILKWGNGGSLPFRRELHFEER